MTASCMKIVHQSVMNRANASETALPSVPLIGMYYRTLASLWLLLCDFQLHLLYPDDGDCPQYSKQLKQDTVTVTFCLIGYRVRNHDDDQLEEQPILLSGDGGGEAGRLEVPR